MAGNFGGKIVWRIAENTSFGGIYFGGIYMAAVLHIGAQRERMGHSARSSFGQDP